jgi:hypothetical protein
MTENFDKSDTITRKDADKQVLQPLIDKLAADPDEQRFFSMNEKQMRRYLGFVRVTDEGFDMNPNFQSPGWGENADMYPAINTSDLGMPEPVLLHELRHALHMFSCVRVFEDPAFQTEAARLFRENVLSDDGFRDWIKTKTNHRGPKNLELKTKTNPRGQKNLEQASELFRNGPPSSDTLGQNAMILGAITYQHAFYLDPGIGEAIGSLKDTDWFMQVNGFLNRNVALAVPGRQFLEGYGNRNYQKLVEEADPLHMAMLTDKKSYDRNWEAFWKS